MKVLYAKSSTLVSWAVRADTWSSCSHVALLESDGEHVIEARFPQGVQRVTLAAFTADNGFVWCREIPCKDEAAALAWAASQIGQPYDWSALAGFVMHRDWASTGKWFCSELVAAAFDKGGSPLFNMDCLNRVTPEHMVIIHSAPVLTPAFNKPLAA